MHTSHLHINCFVEWKYQALVLLVEIGSVVNWPSQKYKNDLPTSRFSVMSPTVKKQSLLKSSAAVLE